MAALNAVQVRQKAQVESPVCARRAAGTATLAPAEIHRRPGAGLATAQPGPTISQGPRVQRSLDVGAADDPLEFEAEQVAAQVVSRLRQRSTSDHSASPGSHDPCCGGGSGVRRWMRRGGSADNGAIDIEGGTLGAQTEARLRATCGSRQAMAAPIRGSLEQAFGADLSAIRLHAGAEASALNRLMSAQAFTHGQNIYIRDGLPDATSASGLHLLSHEITHTLQQGAVARKITSIEFIKGAAEPCSRVQRSVGFEFETGWMVSRANGKAFSKYDTLFTGVGWRMEADQPREGLSDVEFVVKPPFEENAAGRNALGIVMGAVQHHFGLMVAAAGGTGKDIGVGPSANAFVDAVLHDDVRFESGDESATPQTTVGVRLERLMDLLNELSRPGSNAESELMGLADRGPSNTATIDKVTDVIDGTLTTISLRDHRRGFGYQPSEAMKGLVAMLVLYLRRGAIVPNVDLYGQAFKYAKMVTILMARTNFAGMFKQLPQAEKDYYQAHPDHWVDFVIMAAQDSKPDADFAPAGNVIARGIKGDAPKYRGAKQKTPGKVTPIPLSREDWLKGMLIGHDLLNASAFARFKPKETVQFSGAFGALGETTDAVGPAQNSRGVILELREVRQDRHYLDWAQFATDVFDYIQLLNAYAPGVGPAPQYTKTATPGRGVRQ